MTWHPPFVVYDAERLDDARLDEACARYGAFLAALAGARPD